MLGAFEGILADEGIVTEQQKDVDFKGLAKGWKKITKFMGRINKLADERMG